MSKKKSNPPEAWDKAGPAGGSLMEGYTWCPECQAAYEGEVCPGCVDLSGAGAGPEAPPKGCPACNVAPGGTIPTTEDGKCLSCGRDVMETGPTTLAEVAEQAFTETTTITEILPVPLSDPEYKEFGIKLGLANQEISQAKNKLASVKSQYKARITSAEGRRNEYSSVINAGHQQKSVECHLVKDFIENTITEILPVPLSDPEYKEFGIKLGLANQEISQAEDELASVKSQYKARITSAEGRRNEYSSVINAGHQQKSVECHLVKDFIENTITLIRLDTGEIVRTRTMTSAERQRGLFQPPPPDPSCIDPTD